MKKNRSDRIEEAVYCYKNSSNEKDKEEAIILLMNSFEPLINKYHRILKDNSNEIFNNSNKGLRNLMTKKKSEEKFKNTKIFLSVVSNQISNEDLDSILKISLITLINRYECTGKTFLCYVDKAFKFEVMRNVKKEMDYMIPYSLYFDDVKEQININKIEDTSADVIKILDKKNKKNLFNLNYIKSMSNLEKFIIRKFYLEDIRVKEISYLTTLSESYIKAIKKDAVDKIKGYYDNTIGEKIMNKKLRNDNQKTNFTEKTLENYKQCIKEDRCDFVQRLNKGKVSIDFLLFSFEDEMLSLDIEVFIPKEDYNENLKSSSVNEPCEESTVLSKNLKIPLVKIFWGSILDKKREFEDYKEFNSFLENESLKILIDKIPAIESLLNEDLIDLN